MKISWLIVAAVVTALCDVANAPDALACGVPANLVAVSRTGNLTAPSMKASLVQVVDFIEIPIEMEALTGTTR